MIALAVLTVYALLEGQLGIGVTLATATAGLLAFGIEGTGTAQSLAVSQLRQMEDEEVQPPVADGEGEAALIEPPQRPQPPQWSGPSLPHEVPTALIRRSYARSEGREGPR